MTKKSRRNRINTSTPKTQGTKEAPHSRPPISRENFLVAATVVGIAYLAVPLFLGIETHPGTPSTHNVPIFQTEDFTKSFAESIEERLLDEWQPGKSVTVKTIEDGNRGRGLFATKDIRKGEVIARVQYPDLEAEITREHPNLKSAVETALIKAVKRHSAWKWTTLTSGKVLSLLKFLLEDSLGEESIWDSFIQTIPRNVSNMAWYWTEAEKKCAVPRPNSNSLHLDLQVYHSVMADVKDSFPPLNEIYTKEKTEWAYLMLKTRGFGQYFLPVLHLANHNPLESVPAFLIPHAGTAVYVATHEIKAGHAVYTTYGPMTPVVTAEQYGFVEKSSAYIEIPSILEDLRKSERTKNEPLCNVEPVRLFGSVPTKVVGTKFKNAGHSTYFKAFMPDERSYACIRVLLQTERDTDVAAYIAEKLEVDYNRYKAMAEATHCQSDEGNFPLIREANEVSARLMWGALDVAKQGRDFKIPYPGIPTYIMNYS